MLDLSKNQFATLRPIEYNDKVSHAFSVVKPLIQMRFKKKNHDRYFCGNSILFIGCWLFELLWSLWINPALLTSSWHPMTSDMTFGRSASVCGPSRRAISLIALDAQLYCAIINISASLCWKRKTRVIRVRFSPALLCVKKKHFSFFFTSFWTRNFTN